MTFTASLDSIAERNANGLLAMHATWRRVRLGEVASILNGAPFASSKFNESKGQPLLRIRDVLRGFTETLYDGEYNPLYLVNPGDLVVGMDGDFNSALWQGSIALLNQRVCKLSPNEDFYDKKLLSYVLPGFLRAINAETSSVTVKHLSSKTIEYIPLPFPPREEQHRIAFEIDKHFSRLAAAVAALRGVKASLRRYRAAVLKAACEGRLVPQDPSGEPATKVLRRNHDETRQEQVDDNPLTKDMLPRGWSCMGVGPLLSSVRSGMKTGPFGSLLKKHEHRTDGVPVLGIENVRPMHFLYGSKIHISEDKARDLAEYDVQPDDVLISRSGTVGHVCVVPAGIGRAIFSTNVMRIVVDPEIVLPRFFSLLFGGSPFVRTQISNLCCGTTRDFLNQQILGSLFFPVPSLSEQIRIVSEVERRLSVVDKLETVVDANLKRAERLRQAILKRAFEGKLVPQDPNDEPASALLERIRRTRQETEGQRSRRGAQARLPNL